ncbi:uncharacterized protein LOC115995921 [Ipomoea triloba]|uniref:uncharacterized protein LOC115995921 n=1 Tax=Ipomoea triloba TaxID=35885 RepID=UPI00125E1686|nr:uncharacterized protein LOC115995921 [Ipomoea triloba]
MGTPFPVWVNQNMGRINKAQQCLLAVICWEIWRQRNEKVWKNAAAIHNHQLINKVKSFLCAWRKAKKQQIPPNHTTPIPDHKWRRPRVGMLKMNVDAAINKHAAAMGLDNVIRDEEGAFVATRGAQWRGNFTPREAEAVSCHTGSFDLAEISWYG